ncbi:hypothetical protein ACTSKR_01095 [Chitinibacteraceae bacterium HSL-7]
MAADLQPFASDGCSLFPDRALISAADWCDCCVAHDVAYWQGGSASDRLRADEALRQCVETRTGDEHLAALMFAGVRAGGGPHFYTSYRWGYGWSGRYRYQALDAKERLQVAKALAATDAPRRNAVCQIDPLPGAARVRQLLIDHGFAPMVTSAQKATQP